MRIRLTSIFVDDQEKALDFYTWPLGFEVKHDIPVGEHRWLTMVWPEDREGPELLLEPNEHPAAKAYQEALFNDKIPVATFFVENVVATYDRLLSKGVVFITPPTEVGSVTLAVFNDTCGNLIQITDG